MENDIEDSKLGDGGVCEGVVSDNVKKKDLETQDVVRDTHLLSILVSHKGIRRCL
jgi:hypothetical protein